MSSNTKHRVAQGAPVARTGVKQQWELGPGQKFKPLGAGGFFMQLGEPEKAGKKRIEREEKTGSGKGVDERLRASSRRRVGDERVHATTCKTRIVFVEGEIYLIRDKEKKIVGIGKRYDGFKVKWVFGKEFQAIDEREANTEPGQVNAQQSFEFKKQAKFRVEQFKQDLIKEAKRNPNSDCAKFVKKNAQAMGLQF